MVLSERHQTALPNRSPAEPPPPPPLPATSVNTAWPRNALHRVWLREPCLERVSRRGSCVIWCQFGFFLSVFSFFFLSTNPPFIRKSGDLQPEPRRNFPGPQDPGASDSASSDGGSCPSRSLAPRASRRAARRALKDRLRVWMPA